LDKDTKIYSQACPLFVPLVEEGWFDHPATRLIAQEYLKPVLAEQIDTLVLGCTHYPLVKPLLQEIVGPKIKLIDSAEAMAEATGDLLNNLIWEITSSVNLNICFASAMSPTVFKRSENVFWAAL